MFPDSEITKKYQLGADKMRYSINSGIRPHFKQILMNNVQKSRFYILSFDESLNQSTQTSELDLLVRYFDITDRRVYTRYISSEFLGHARHMDLLRNFANMTDEMFEGKLVQLSMDGPAVNLKFLAELQKDRKEKGLPQLINIRSCGLHTGHLKLVEKKVTGI